MAQREKYTVKQVEAALRAAAGVQTLAAQKLGCARTTLQGYLNRHPELQDATAQIIEETIDLAEAQLVSAIKAGNLTAVIFYLKTKGVHRGYQERRDLRISIDNMTEDQLVDFLGGEPEPGELEEAGALARSRAAGRA